MRGGYHCLFKQVFGPLRKVLEYEDQWCLGLFLLELKRHREKLLKDNNTAAQANQQRTVTTFFLYSFFVSPATPSHATSQSRTTQLGSQPGQCKSILIYKTIAICHARRPSLMDHDLTVLKEKIEAIISCHRGSCLALENSPFWINLC